VPGQFSGLRRRVDRPYEDPAVAAARDDLSSVRAEGDGCDVAVMVDPDRILAESVAPEIEPAVAAAGSNSRAVRTDGDLQNAVSGADQGFVTPRSAGSPEAHECIGPAADDQLSVGACRDTQDLILVCSENNGRSVARRPQPHGPILRSTHDEATCGIDRDAGHQVLVTCQH